MSVEELVEQGEIYIMTHCSSSSADQAGLMPERVACLDCPSDHIVTENGIKVSDKMHFFKGDKQSAWFEAGIQRGGHYCCIACNCSTMGFCDFTEVHHFQLRSYTDIHLSLYLLYRKIRYLPNNMHVLSTLCVMCMYARVCERVCVVCVCVLVYVLEYV